jgi:ribosomal protein L11 methyltransferase
MAVALGARSAHGIDVDADVVPVARENAARNAFGSRATFDTTPLERIKSAYAVVLANIEARVLVPMAAELEKRVAPGGLLLLSGVLEAQADAVQRAYASMELVERTEKGEWVLLVLRAKG